MKRTDYINSEGRLKGGIISGIVAIALLLITHYSVTVAVIMGVLVSLNIVFTLSRKVPIDYEYHASVPIDTVLGMTMVAVTPTQYPILVVLVALSCILDMVIR